MLSFPYLTYYFLGLQLYSEFFICLNVYHVMQNILNKIFLGVQTGKQRMLHAAVIRKEEKDCLVTWRLLLKLWSRMLCHSNPMTLLQLLAPTPQSLLPFWKHFYSLSILAARSLKMILLVQTCNIGVVNRKSVTKF